MTAPTLPGLGMARAEAGPDVGEGGEVLPTSGTPPRVIGLDVSLTSTGVAGPTWALTVHGPSLAKTPKGTRPDYEAYWHRIRTVRRHLIDFIDGAELVVIEGLAFSQNDPTADQRDALWWYLVGRCITRSIAYAVVSTGTLKVYATGNGRASKEDVVQEVQRRRPDVEFKGNDQADALCLAAMGCEHLGHPVVALPQTHRRALDAVHWPVSPR